MSPTAVNRTDESRAEGTAGSPQSLPAGSQLNTAESWGSFADESEQPVRGQARVLPRSQRAVQVLDNTFRITTPENISFQYSVCGPFRRAFTYLLDVVFSMLIYGLLVLCVYLLVLAFGSLWSLLFGNANVATSILSLLSGLVSVGFFIVYWFYGAWMETYFNGQTIGKRLTSMRVISTDGHAIDGVQATLRNFFRLLDMMPIVPLSLFFSDLGQAALPTGLFGLIVMASSKRYQRLGDWVAGTVVINEDHQRRPKLVIFADSRVPQLAELIPNSFVASAALTRTIADYADQRVFLPPARLDTIAARVAEPLLAQLDLAADTDSDLFVCALYYRLFAATGAGDAIGPVDQAAAVGTFMLTPAAREQWLASHHTSGLSAASLAAVEAETVDAPSLLEDSAESKPLIKAPLTTTPVPSVAVTPPTTDPTPPVDLRSQEPQ